jgi:hypothetical protein
MLLMLMRELNGNFDAGICAITVSTVHFVETAVRSVD